jgi:PAS domain S-box-containing protein
MTDGLGTPVDSVVPSTSPPAENAAGGSRLGELENIRYAIDQSAIVATTDVRGRITYVNDQFCRISGYGRAELLGRDHRILNSGLHHRAFIRNLWTTIANGRVWRGELRNRRKDGSFYWVDTTIVPFLDAHRKPWQYMAIRYDITERKQNEVRLREQATLATLGEMAAVVAHEVRNPLAGIRGGVQVLSSYLSPSATEAHEFIREICGRIDSLNAAITDLLEFARLREPKLAPVDIGLLLSDVVKSLQYDPVLAGVTWSLQTACPGQVKGDVDQLRLLFTNLAINAAQAAGASGHVWLGAAQEGGACAVDVADDGPGVPPDTHARVFEPFFTTKHRGTGLGLPTAKRIVEAHGGSIRLLDRPGGGTIAQVVLELEAG